MWQSIFYFKFFHYAYMIKTASKFWWAFSRKVSVFSIFVFCRSKVLIPFYLFSEYSILLFQTIFNSNFLEFEFFELRKIVFVSNNMIHLLTLRSRINPLRVRILINFELIFIFGGWRCIRVWVPKPKFYTRHKKLFDCNAFN